MKNNVIDGLDKELRLLGLAFLICLPISFFETAFLVPLGKTFKQFRTENVVSLFKQSLIMFTNLTGWVFHMVKAQPVYLFIGMAFVLFVTLSFLYFLKLLMEKFFKSESEEQPGDRSTQLGLISEISFRKLILGGGHFLGASLLWVGFIFWGFFVGYAVLVAYKSPFFLLANQDRVGTKLIFFSFLTIVVISLFYQHASLLWYTLLGMFRILIGKKGREVIHLLKRYAWKNGYFGTFFLGNALFLSFILIAFIGSVISGEQRGYLWILEWVGSTSVKAIYLFTMGLLVVRGLNKIIHDFV